MRCTAKPLHLIRHAETVANVQRRWMGWNDTPLTERGRARRRPSPAAWPLR